ncbi:MAG TPA: bifunctional 3-hydroxydecanoyl-ACP dehydratase/trans-2-decenoyl-ACP isomerase [Steroidobacteraceae bacterium]|nr:bifunctional 3-hydroxydecanoyl-ACP dehydratase/trans-2-decenoyl-ACP isomerase [Steroidobacteraceae bacterium]
MNRREEQLSATGIARMPNASSEDQSSEVPAGGNGVDTAGPRQSSYSREELIACGEGKLFGPNSPRLPSGQMLMVDRITDISLAGGAHGRGVLHAELDIDPSMWFFACHFRGDPVMPGCLGLDALWQLVGFFMAWSGHRGLGRALGVDEVRFFGQVQPHVKRVSYQIDIKRVITRRLIMATAEGSLAADGRQIYSASGLRVGLFENADALQPPAPREAA